MNAGAGSPKKTHVATAAALVILLLSGCAKTSRTPLMEDLSPQDLSSQELRARLYTAVVRFDRLVSNNADLIRAASDDLVIHEAALRWKLYATSHITAAAFRIDPLFGYIDSWGLAAQMHQAFRPGGALGDVFGEHQHLALEAARLGEALFVDMAPMMLSDTTAARDAITKFATDNPIGDFRVGRTSIIEAGGPSVSQYRSSAFGVGEMQTTLEDLNARMPIMVDNGIRQAVWRIELMLAERDIDGAVNAIVADLDSIDASALRVADAVASLDQRVALLDSLVWILERERLAVLGDVDRQRRETLDAVTMERVAVLEAVDAQFQVVLSTLLAERVSIMAELDSISDGKIQLATAGLNEVVDHVFWRSLQLLAVAAVLALLTGWLLMRSRRPT